MLRFTYPSPNAINGGTRHFPRKHIRSSHGPVLTISVLSQRSSKLLWEHISFYRVDRNAFQAVRACSQQYRQHSKLPNCADSSPSPYWKVRLTYLLWVVPTAEMSPPPRNLTRFEKPALVKLLEEIICMPRFENSVY